MQTGKQLKVDGKGYAPVLRESRLNQQGYGTVQSGTGRELTGSASADEIGPLVQDKDNSNTNATGD